MTPTSTQYQQNLIKQCFIDKEKFLFCVDKVAHDEVFSDAVLKLYWQIFNLIYKEGVTISISAVQDLLNHTSNADLVGHFQQTIEATYPDEQEWQYHLFYLDEQYKKKILLDLAKEIQQNIGNGSSKELVSNANNILRTLNSEEVQSTSFEKAYTMATTKMRDIQEGKKRSIIYTGNPKFDEVVALSERKMITIAAQKKVGKSRFVVDLVDRIIGNNKDIAIEWFSLEMQSDELIRCFMSRKTKLTDKQLMGKGYKLTDFEMNHIESAYEFFKKYPIEFIDEPVNIYNICSRFERFAERNKGKLPILIIDNLGLIKPHIDNSNMFDDDVARMLKNLRDITGGIIILVHHLTKESESKWNKDTSYEPKTTHIRGSSRIADFSNQIILLHRPDHYPDLVEESAAKGVDIKGMFQVDIAANRDGAEEKIMFKHEIQYCLFTEK